MTQYRVYLKALGQNNRVMHGFSRVVEAQTKDDAAVIALNQSEEKERESMRQHNESAERFGTWKQTHQFTFKVEKVRKVPTKN